MTNAAATVKVTATDRRVRRTQRALREAFIALVVERGYANVTIEDITDRADVARATFYAHFDDKDQLLATLFEELTGDLTAWLTDVEGAPEHLRTEILIALYRHASEYRDLYLVCLRGAGNGRARAAYLDIIADGTERVWVERVRAMGLTTNVEVRIACRAFAGAHVAVLEAWLEDDHGLSFEAMARKQHEVLAYGYAWALGMLPEATATALPKLGEEPLG